MGELREKMMADLVLARYSPRTVEPYLDCARNFAVYFMRSPAEMGEPEVREFLLHLVQRQLAGPSVQKMHVAALKFHPPGRPGRLPTRGSHRSEHAQLGRFMWCTT